MKPANAAVARAAILKRIDGHLQQIAQWAGMQDYARAAHYQTKAEALIEILEVDDCRSSGGFDKARGQGSVPLGMKGLQVRRDWLASLPIAD
jgi:hypothetical protein